MLLRLLFIICTTTGYNLDVDNANIFTDPNPSPLRSSYFGFSVALFGDDFVLVGAPRANGSSRTFVEPGVVYRCPLKSGSSNGCKEWLVDPWADSRRVFQNKYVLQMRDNAWFGATVRVENVTVGTPRVAICAPRWKQNYYESWFMNGMCLTVLPNKTTPSRHFPLMDSNRQVIAFHGDTLYLYGMGQAGFSAVMTPDNPRSLVVGAPGLFYWTGTALQMGERSLRDQFAAVVPRVIGDPNLKPHNYFGYSITSGYYYKRGERLYAAGAPRSADTLGKVFIFTFPRDGQEKLLYKEEFTGEQYGEYFGFSLASCDINNDGRDDLIVGAPLWSNELDDEGQVYVYVSKGLTDFEIHRISSRSTVITGEVSGGRFGTSVACLGDLDRDGYADIAIGAPYVKQGIVGIYYGNAEGKLEMTQRILAPGNQIHGFGIAISEPHDIDGNGYYDIAIGAHLSGHVMVLKSKPTVVLNVNLKTDEKFALTENTTHFFVDTCVKYDGVLAPTFNAETTLTIDKLHKRALVYHNGTIFGHTYRFSDTLRNGEEKCTQVKITLKKNNKNMIDPIEISAWTHSNEPSSCPNCPVMNPILTKPGDFLNLPYSLDCGDDDVCVSDLYVNITTDSNGTFIVGSRTSLNVTVFVTNTGEPAYAARAHIFVPEPIVLARIPPECDEEAYLEKRMVEVVCDVGNPLRFLPDKNEVKTVVMELDMSAVQYTDEFSDIYVNVTTQSKLANDLQDNSLRITYKNDADVTIIGKSYDDWYSYLEKDMNDKNSRRYTFNHIYEILKFGVSPIQESILTLNVPTHWKDFEIASISQIQGFTDGRKYECKNVTNDEESNSSISLSDNTLYEGNNSLVIPAEERTFYINCTDKDVTCRTLKCKLGPFVKLQSSVKLTVTIDFQLSNYTTEAVRGKNIIFFVSEGFVEISQPNVTFESSNKRPDYKQISTIFLIRREPEQVAVWIIVLSVLFGIILLTLMTFLLFKLGFFNRRTKPDQETLKPKEETNKNIDGNENSGTTIE